MRLFAFSLIFASCVHFALSIDDCTSRGRKRGQLDAGNDGTCDAPETVLKSYSGRERMYCSKQYKRACTRAAKKVFCKKGIEQALANETCTKWDRRYGEELTGLGSYGELWRNAYPADCCGCCKTGTNAGFSYKEVSCDSFITGGSSTCNRNIRECCMVARGLISKTIAMLSMLEPCQYGYERKNGVCVDIDECLKGKDPCPGNHICENKDGGYRCKEMNECEMDPNICGAKGICRTYEYGTYDDYGPGTYECKCEKGYMNEDPERESKCVDVNECDTSNGYCAFNCTNSEGSYSCSCPSGWTKDGHACRDINECANNPCAPDELCFNTYGSYKCRPTCEEGYEQTECTHSFCFHKCIKKKCKFDEAMCGDNSIWSYTTYVKAYSWVIPKMRYYFSGHYSIFYGDVLVVELVKGNERKEFGLSRIGAGKIVRNIVEIKGPREIELVLQIDRKLKGVTMSRFMYTLLIYVGKHKVYSRVPNNDLPTDYDF